MYVHICRMITYTYSVHVPAAIAHAPTASRTAVVSLSSEDASVEVRNDPPVAQNNCHVRNMREETECISIRYTSRR